MRRQSSTSLLSTSYSDESISLSSWSSSTTSSTHDEEAMLSTPLDDDAECPSSYEEDLCCPTYRRLRSLSTCEKKIHRKKSFLGSFSNDFSHEILGDYAVSSNKLEDIIQCAQDKNEKLLVFSSSYPYHIEWANSEWSKISGWSSDEIVGMYVCYIICYYIPIFLFQFYAFYILKEIF